MRAKEFILEVNTSLGNKYQDLYTQYYKRAHRKARQQGLTGADADRVARLALDRYKDRVRTGEWDPIARKKGTGRSTYNESESRIPQWMDLGDISMDSKLSLYESVALTGRSLVESNSEDSVIYVRSLKDKSTTPNVGGTYIFTLLALIEDRLECQQAPSIGEVVSINADSYIIRLSDGREAVFPDKTISDCFSIYTVFFDSVPQYNTFRSAVSVKFDTVLPEFKDQLEEDWRHVVTGAGLASMLAGGGSAIYDKMQDTNKVAEPQAHVKQVQAPQANIKAPVAKPQEIDPKKAIAHAKDLMELPAAKYLHKAAVAAGLKGSELAQFMAQTAHESANFSTLKEFGDKNYFKKYDIKFNPSKAKELGNVHVGDGERYKGRGYIQLTGRENYRNAGKALGLPLEQKPELVERPDVAAKVALWFWKNRVKPNVDNFNDTADSTKPINPALKGLADRKNKFAGMKVAATQAPTTLAKTAAQAPSVKPATKPTTVAAKTAPKATTLAKAPDKTAPAAKAAVKQPVKVAAAKPVTKAKKV